MHYNSKTTTFSVDIGHTCTTTLKQQIQCEERSHIQNNNKTTTFRIKKGHTFTTTIKQQHLVQQKVTHTQQHENNNNQ